MSPSSDHIKVVGVSAAGKSTLVAALRDRGYPARAASQEHSQVPDMWRRLHPPAVLVYLDTDLQRQRERRPDVAWSARWLRIERERLRHARAHADLVLTTSALAPAEVEAQVVAFLRGRGLEPGDRLPPSPPTGGSWRAG